jgi:hypothetical protein
MDRVQRNVARCLSVCLSSYLPTYLPTYLSISVCLPACLSIYPSTLPRHDFEQCDSYCCTVHAPANGDSKKGTFALNDDFKLFKTERVLIGG